MNESLEDLIAKYRNRGVLIDSNLLMLYLVGEFDPQQISRLRRTKSFVVRDYLVIKGFFNAFSIKITTPNILTEISNLSGDIPAGLRDRFFKLLHVHFERLGEEYLPSKIGAASPMFARFGLTDSVIAEIAKQQYLVITADFPLANYLASIKADVINFNHLRTLAP